MNNNNNNVDNDDDDHDNNHQYHDHNVIPGDVKQVRPDLPFQSETVKFLQWDTQKFTSQLGDVRCPARPGSGLDLLPVGHAQSSSVGSHPNEMPESPQVTPVEEQWL